MLQDRACTRAPRCGAFVVSSRVSFTSVRACAVFAALRKLVRYFAVLVVGVVLVHALEDHVPLCRCVADAVRETAVYAHLAAYLADADPLGATIAASKKVNRFLEAPPTLGEIVTEDRRERVAETWTAVRTQAAEAIRPTPEEE